MTKEEAQEKLNKVASYIEIKEYKPGGTRKSVFYDHKRNVEFEYFFQSLVSNFKKNPEFMPCPTGEDLNKVKQAQAIKRKDTNVKRYGVSCTLNNETVREKKLQTWRKNGYENPSLDENVKLKKKETYLKKYGVDNPSKSEEVQKRKINTSISRFGVSHPLKSPEIKQKSKETCWQKYGVPYTGAVPSRVQKAIDTRVLNNEIALVRNKTLRQWALDYGYSYTYVLKLHKAGIDVSNLENYKDGTAIECVIKEILEGNVYIFNKSLTGSSYRPDFLLPEHKLVIECDGLYWHSDVVDSIHKEYHKEKLDAYESLGYRALFFREDEILGRTNVVESIIKNKLNQSHRVYARNCKICCVKNSDFFEENHLMGSGAGRQYFLVDSDGRFVAGMQVRWKNKKNRVLDISRFCPVLNTTVVGGFSKLLKYVLEQEKASFIQTFIDRRYGNGHYLSSLGFEFKRSYLSFKWTDFKNTYHRMAFPSNSGYSNGLYKIWDCGQSLWLKKI